MESIETPSLLVSIPNAEYVILWKRKVEIPPRSLLGVKGDICKASSDPRTYRSDETTRNLRQSTFISNIIRARNLCEVHITRANTQSPHQHRDRSMIAHRSSSKEPKLPEGPCIIKPWDQKVFSASRAASCECI